MQGSDGLLLPTQKGGATGSPHPSAPSGKCHKISRIAFPFPSPFALTTLVFHQLKITRFISNSSPSPVPFLRVRDTRCQSFSM